MHIETDERFCRVHLTRCIYARCWHCGERLSGCHQGAVDALTDTPDDHDCGVARCPECFAMKTVRTIEAHIALTHPEAVQNGR